MGLDFYQLYKAQEIQTSEAAAISYLERLVTTRFRVFGETSPTISTRVFH